MLVLNLGLRIAAAIFSVPPEALSPLLSLPMMMLEPPATDAEMASNRKFFEEVILHKAWDNEREGFEADDDWIVDRYQMDDDGPGPSTYGEVTTLGARQLFHHMGMMTTTTTTTTTTKKTNNDIEFWDLGSGAGRLIIQSFLELPSVTSAVGMELCPSRHEIAFKARETFLHLLSPSPDDNDTTATTITLKKDVSLLKFIQGDILDSTNRITATHIYVASLCFTPDMMHSMADVLLKNCPNLQIVASLQPIPFPGKLIPTCRVEYIEASWTKGQGCVVYIYNMNKKVTR